MSTKEKLHFLIELGGIYWARKPMYNILINGQNVATGTIDSVSGTYNSADSSYQHTDTQVVEFDHEVDNGAVRFEIEFFNKTDKDVIENADKTAIAKDMLLCIKRIEIDQINLGNLIWTHSRFEPKDPQRPVLTRCVDLGWNGRWIMDIESPFYIWLLENI